MGYERPPAGTPFPDIIYCREDNTWSDHVPKCTAKCGTISFGVPYISGGREVNISEAPWHVAIYEKQPERYEQICGGTIISVDAVVSAAHCFWDESTDTLKDASRYLVVAGKTLRDYYYQEAFVQEMRVQSINTVIGYGGKDTLYTGDLAVLKLSSSFHYQVNIVPVCVRFYTHAEKVIFD